MGMPHIGPRCFQRQSPQAPSRQPYPLKGLSSAHVRLGVQRVDSDGSSELFNGLEVTIQVQQVNQPDVYVRFSEQPGKRGTSPAPR